MKNKEIEELLNMLKKCSREDKATLKLNEIACKTILSYIEQLEKKVDQYENPDDLTLFYMWLDTKAKDKMKQLEKRNKELYEGFMATQEELTDYATKNEQLENNRDKAIEYLEKSKLNQLDTHCKYLYIDFGAEKIENIDELLNILKGDSDE